MDGTFYYTTSFVANVNVDADGRLALYVNRLDNPNVWNSQNRNRVVVPQLTFSTALYGGSF